jgi:dTDP-4-amino-4,6-dideoxygalactose transaminase
MQTIRDIAGRIPLIEDCAHSMYSPGALNNPLPEPSGDLLISSFGFGKFPGIGTGGVLVCRNGKYLEEIRREYESLHLPGRKEELRMLCKTMIIRIAFLVPLYGLVTYHLGRKLDRNNDLLQKDDLSESKAFPYTLQLLVRNHEFYQHIRMAKQKKAESLILQMEKGYPDSFKNNLFFPFLHSQSEQVQTRITRKGYHCSGHFADSICLGGKYGYSEGACPITERIAQRVLTVPIHARISSRRLKLLTSLINQAFREEIR